MELGISPIVTTSMVLQFLAGSNIVQIDQSLKEDRMLFQQTQKFCGRRIGCYSNRHRNFVVGRGDLLMRGWSWLCIGFY